MTWKDDISNYAEFPEGEWVEVKFLETEPTIEMREYDGKKKKNYEWNVEVNGVKKLLSKSAIGLIAKLAKIDDLTAAPVRIQLMKEGAKYLYLVEQQKKIKASSKD
jgi:hypothetical protein